VISLENKMSFEEFCEPFKETANMLIKNGITKEKFRENVERSKKEFAEKFLRDR